MYGTDLRTLTILSLVAFATSAHASDDGLVVRNAAYNSYVITSGGRGRIDGDRMQNYSIELGIPFRPDTLMSLRADYVDDSSNISTDQSGFDSVTVSLTRAIKPDCRNANDVERSPYRCVDFLSLEAGIVAAESTRRKAFRDSTDAYVGVRGQLGESLARLDASLVIDYSPSEEDQGDFRATVTAGVRSTLKDFHIGMNLITSKRRGRETENSYGISYMYRATRELAVLGKFEKSIDGYSHADFIEIGLRWHFLR